MILVALCLIGALLIPLWRGAGVALVLASSLSLFVLSTPAASSVLLRWAEAGQPPIGDLTKAQAIVVLGGALVPGDGAGIPDVLGAVSLERVVFAADAQRKLHLPVLVSGGSLRAGHVSESILMRQALEQQFGIAVQWNEDRARTTWENAVFSAAILQPAGVKTVLLVTQAWHMPRAVWAFERAGLRALAWPAPRTAVHAEDWDDFLPHPWGLQDSLRALHEFVGMAYYRIRY